MGTFNDHLDARENYIELIKEELLGPGSEVSVPDKAHEIISTSPRSRYSIGILFPQDNKFNADNDDSFRAEESSEIEDVNVDEQYDSETESGSDDKAESVAPSEEDNLDEEISLAAQNMPSSFGFTFLSSADLKELICDIEFGTYERVKKEDCRIPFRPVDSETYVLPSELSSYVFFDQEDSCLKLCREMTKREFKELKGSLGKDNKEIFDAMERLCNQLGSGFVRSPHSSEVSVDFSSGDYTDDNKEIDGTKAKLTVLKRKIPYGIYSYTVMLVNDAKGRPTGSNCIFQPVIKISSVKNGFTFKEYASLTDFKSLDIEEQTLELLYRNKKVYGTGLGTALNWEIDAYGNGTIYNDFFPEAEVPTMDFSIPPYFHIDKTVLSMRRLSDLDDSQKEQKIEGLKSVIDAYNNWINQLEEQRATLEEKYRDIAEINILGCRKACERMGRGIQILKENEQSWQAFMLANRAMFMQRVHLELQAEMSDIDIYPGDSALSERLDSLDYSVPEGITEDRYIWRLFQIAFLLMSIEGIIYDSSTDREMVDLIWFPTGGGKTEAYLGLMAFTIFYRRLAHPEEADGTAVIMRYTLRLLTAQQFTRASTLICACEFIREDSTSNRSKYGKYPLGDSEITIGLWIGGNHIPNRNDLAKGDLKELQRGTASNIHDIKELHNKFQVLKCPWCGTKMVKDCVDKKLVGSFGYRMRNNQHFELFCPQDSCYFREKLPIQIIDEELYASPPTLLFGTVDKFAMLPWKRDVGSFFAVGTVNRPPELIIQDELHLISGPLGTMVGLYESAIDVLCRGKGGCAKIVASTATIRRAKEQCSALYNREVNQFPHPGLDAEDSFFARETVIDYPQDKFGRKYIGLMPSGKTKAMLEARSVATLMQEINNMDLSDEIKDEFWTLTVYFNSLKDLGKCSTLIDDDVRGYISGNAYRSGNVNAARKFGRADELTSRVSTTRLNETLDKLEKLSYCRENIEKKKYPSNVLLATNMISVGIDVERLNVMLLVGQPKLTSEYIQASSRVGRKYPGVVFVMYDGSKSRDRSHYEQFKSYHESFYKYVEPTAVTPFAKPARDRALHAVVIAMVRMLESELASEEDAARFNVSDYSDRMSQITNSLTTRAADISNRMNAVLNDDSVEIADDIDFIFRRWESRAKEFDEEHFYYGEKFMVHAPQKDEGRLLKPFNTSREDPAFDTMTSMRNVDSAIRCSLIIWEET